MRYLLCAMLIAAAACNELPLEPSPVASEAREALGVTFLRWDRAAPGCSPQTPPSPLPNAASAHIERISDDVVTASWPHTMSAGRPVILHARFVRIGEEMLLCYWDYADA